MCLIMQTLTLESNTLLHPSHALRNMPQSLCSEHGVITHSTLSHKRKLQYCTLKHVCSVIMNELFKVKVSQMPQYYLPVKQSRLLSEVWNIMKDNFEVFKNLTNIIFTASR